MSSTSRAAASQSKRIVVKIGSAVLTGGSDSLDRAYLHDLGAAIAKLKGAGREVILVSSGAVAAGLAPLKMSSRPADVAGQQAAAAAGQPLLMSLWTEALAVRRVPAAQVLLGGDDFDSRERFLNIRNCIGRLLELGAVPIINENDTVATQEISLGDNDQLAARIAGAAQADLLVILTGVGGVLDAGGSVVPESEGVTPLLSLVRTEQSRQGRGGMSSKLGAARTAGLSGVPTLIAPGRPADSLLQALAGAQIGTFIAVAGAASGSVSARHAGKRLWIALSVAPAGDVVVDAGAAAALRKRGASLLAKGVVGVSGKFAMGDVVRIVEAAPGGGASGEIARGLTNFASGEIAAIKGLDSSALEKTLGRQVHQEVVHRDNLALTEP